MYRHCYLCISRCKANDCSDIFNLYQSSNSHVNIPYETFLELHQVSDISSVKLYSMTRTCNLEQTNTMRDYKNISFTHVSTTIQHYNNIAE